MTTDTNPNADANAPTRPSLGHNLLARFLPDTFLAGSSGWVDLEVEGTSGSGPPPPCPTPAGGMLTPISESPSVQDLHDPRNKLETRGRSQTKTMERWRQLEWRLGQTPEISISSSRSPSGSRDMHHHPDPVHFEREPHSPLQSTAALKPGPVARLTTKRKSYKPRLPPVSITLQNSGAVARDHLASERTFLAYTRTSLAMASMGVALVQLFTIADHTSQATGVAIEGPAKSVQKFAKPLGMTMISLAMMVLGVGAYRYFLIQWLLPSGKFPVARVPVMGIALVLGSVIVVVFASLVSGRG